jgi:NADP-dependent 3-hydroxy acid dehydrogenase YdfG
MSELPAGERMKLEKLDVCSSESVEELRKKVIEEYGHVDIL